MSYETAAFLTQMLSLAIFAAVFAGMLFYALRPANRKRFDAAARLALNNDDTLETGRNDER